MRGEIDGHRDDTSKFRHPSRSTNYMQRRRITFETFIPLYTQVFSVWNNPSSKSTGLQLRREKAKSQIVSDIAWMVFCTGCCSLLLHEWRIFQTFKWHHPFLIHILHFKKASTKACSNGIHLTTCQNQCNSREFFLMLLFLGTHRCHCLRLKTAIVGLPRSQKCK